MQAKRFGTFVVRYWTLPRDEGRLEIEHVQSGARHRCASLPEAEAWIAARVRAHAPGQPVQIGRDDETAGQGMAPDGERG